MTNKDIFSKRLKELRIKKGITQKDLAERVNASPKSMSAYENSGRIPELDVLINIATELDCTLDYLFGISNTPNLNFQQKIKVDHYIKLVNTNSDKLELYDLIDMLDVKDFYTLLGEAKNMIKNSKYNKKGEYA